MISRSEYNRIVNQTCEGVTRGGDLPVPIIEYTNDGLFAFAEAVYALVFEQYSKNSCEWKQDDDGNWQTTCGEMIDEGTHIDDRIAFCCYCGAKLKFDMEIRNKLTFPMNES